MDLLPVVRHVIFDQSWCSGHAAVVGATVNRFMSRGSHVHTTVTVKPARKEKSQHGPRALVRNLRDCIPSATIGAAVLSTKAYQIPDGQGPELSGQEWAGYRWVGLRPVLTAAKTASRLEASSRPRFCSRCTRLRDTRAEVSSAYGRGLQRHSA